MLKYRLVECKTDNPPAELDDKAGEEMDEACANLLIPLALADGQAAIAYVRQHAAEYGVDPKRIGIIGFSAGGTVAGSVAFNYDANSFNRLCRTNLVWNTTG